MTVVKRVRYIWEEKDISVGREVVHEHQPFRVIYTPSKDLQEATGFVAGHKFAKGGFFMLDTATWQTRIGPCTQFELAGRFTAMSVAPRELYRNDETVG